MALRASVNLVKIGPEAAAQRVDNFLLKHCKGVPRSHVYRIVRSGEVRVNSGRVDASHKLQVGDVVRIPPIRLSVNIVTDPPSEQAVTAAKEVAAGIRTVYEDEDVLVVDKPAGLSSHGGTGMDTSVIDCLRTLFPPPDTYLELVHRLDRGTSGLLMLAKSRPALLSLQSAFLTGHVRKTSLALVTGAWLPRGVVVEAPLATVRDGSDRKRSVVVAPGTEGAHACRTVFEFQRAIGSRDTLVRASLETGRLHQVRAHLAHVGHPVLGDNLYGSRAANHVAELQGLKRMFLHAQELSFRHPTSGRRVRVDCPLPPELQKYIARRTGAPAPAPDMADNARNSQGSNSQRRGRTPRK